MSNNGAGPPAANRITPFRAPLHVPCAVRFATPARTCGGAPPRSIRFNFWSAKKPSDSLSGDQKGFNAPSVPGSGCAEVELRGRTHKREGPSAEATKAMSRPSGESEKDAGELLTGVKMSSRVSVAPGGPSAKSETSTDIAYSSASTAQH